jgi:sulfur carrier protein
VKVLINGEPLVLADGATVADVLRRFGAPASGVAVACGGEVVPKASWSTTSVRDGDELEVLTAVQGG